MSESVDIRALKGIALKIDDPLKTLILSENDKISREKYFELSEQWLKILKIQKEGEGK